jgi:hypothetical protein
MVTMDPTGDYVAIKYGGVSHDYFPDSKCPRCKESIDSHHIPFIRPGDVTLGLACLLQDLLSKLDVESILKGKSLSRNSTMVGAAQARFGNGGSRDYVTVSGEGVLLLAHINRKRLRAEVAICENSTAVETNSSLYGIDGEIFLPAILHRPPTPPASRLTPPHVLWPVPEKVAYPLGSCAAQKLLTRIFEDAQTMGGVMAIEMSEIMWRSSQIDRVPQTSRQWSTGHAALPCETCKQVLPQMLCDKHD